MFSRTLQERVKLYKLQIWHTYSQGPCEQKPLKIGEKRERGRIQGLPQFLTPLYYLRNG